MLPVILPPLSTVLFDLDGTLVDSNDAHAYAWFQAFEEVDRPTPFNRIRALIGMGADQLLPALDPHFAPNIEPGKTATQRQREIFKKRYLPSIRPQPGARQLLLALKEREIQCVVATSASEKELDALLEIADIADLIDARATADDASVSKPAPDIVLAALLKARTRVINAVLVGDTRFDILAAHAAGIPAISLRCGGNPEHELVDSAGIFDTPADLMKAVTDRSLRDIVTKVRLSAT